MFAIELVTTENLLSELTRRADELECSFRVYDALDQLEHSLIKVPHGSNAGGT